MAEFLVMCALLVVVPALLILWLAKARHIGKLDLTLQCLAPASYLTFVFLWGQYPTVAESPDFLQIS